LFLVTGATGAKTRFGDGPRKGHGEKLNDERGIKPLPVRTRRDVPKREEVYAEG
jgi:hypothetical protein